MPRNRSPIGSLARAADCTSRLSGLPGRIGGAARGETEPDACVTAGTAAAAAFGTEIGTAGARGEVAAETGGDALEAAGAPVSAGAGPPAFSESKAANGGDGSAARPRPRWPALPKPLDWLGQQAGSDAAHLG